MHPSRIVIVIGTLIALASLPLSFLELPTLGGVNGFDGDAWPAVVALAVPASMAVLGDRPEGFVPGAALVAMLTSAGAVIFAAFKLADATQAADAAGGSLGVGIWVLLFGSVAALLGSALGLTNRLG